MVVNVSPTAQHEVRALPWHANIHIFTITLFEQPSDRRPGASTFSEQPDVMVPGIWHARATISAHRVHALNPRRGTHYKPNVGSVRLTYLCFVFYPEFRSGSACTSVFYLFGTHEAATKSEATHDLVSSWHAVGHGMDCDCPVWCVCWSRVNGSGPLVCSTRGVVFSAYHNRNDQEQ